MIALKKLLRKQTQHNQNITIILYTNPINEPIHPSIAIIAIKANDFF
jgi:hypothetical protein